MDIDYALEFRYAQVLTRIYNKAAMKRAVSEWKSF